eukprot:g2501.t1
MCNNQAGEGTSTGGDLVLRGGAGITAGDVKIGEGGQTTLIAGNELSVTSSEVNVTAAKTTFSSEVVFSGSLTIGTSSAPFNLGRTTTSSADTYSFTISGQASTHSSGVGGDVVIAGGEGATGGDVLIDGGDGTLSGSVVIGASSQSVTLGASTHSSVSLIGTGVTLGNEDAAYTISRATGSGTGRSTSLTGQTGAGTFAGGDLYLYAGDSGSLPSDTASTSVYGGDLSLEAGRGYSADADMAQTMLGSSVLIGTGSGTKLRTSSVLIGQSLGTVTIQAPLTVRDSITSSAYYLSLDAGSVQGTTPTVRIGMSVPSSVLLGTTGGSVSVGSDLGVAGDITLSPAVDGDDVYLTIADTTEASAYASSLIIQGQGNDTVGGDVSLSAGSSYLRPGSLYLDAGAPSASDIEDADRGSVVIGTNASQTLVTSPLTATSTTTLYSDVVLGSAVSESVAIYATAVSEVGGIDVSLSAGEGTVSGGDLTLKAGEGGTTGGTLSLDGGAGAAAKGDVVIGAGSAGVYLGLMDASSSVVIESPTLLLGDPDFADIGRTDDNMDYVIARAESRRGVPSSDTYLVGQHGTSGGGDLYLAAGGCVDGYGIERGTDSCLADSTSGSVYIRTGMADADTGTSSQISIGDTGGLVVIGSETDSTSAFSVQSETVFAEGVTFNQSIVLGDTGDGAPELAGYTITLDTAHSIAAPPSLSILGQSVEHTVADGTAVDPAYGGAVYVTAGSADVTGERDTGGALYLSGGSGHVGGAVHVSGGMTDGTGDAAAAGSVSINTSGGSVEIGSASGAVAVHAPLSVNESLTLNGTVDITGDRMTVGAEDIADSFTLSRPLSADADSLGALYIEGAYSYAYPKGDDSQGIVGVNMASGGDVHMGGDLLVDGDTLTLGSDGSTGAFTVTRPSDVTDTAGHKAPSLQVVGGAALHTGGDVMVTGGQGDVLAGDVYVDGGSSPSSGTGSVYIGTSSDAVLLGMAGGLTTVQSDVALNGYSATLGDGSGDASLSRPSVSGLAGGDFTIQGQSSDVSGGDLILQAGCLSSDPSDCGVVSIGSDNEDTSVVIVGPLSLSSDSLSLGPDAVSASYTISRPDVAGSASLLSIQGQGGSGVNGAGGDLSVTAGRSSESVGGDLLLEGGDSGTGDYGSVVIGASSSGVSLSQGGRVTTVQGSLSVLESLTVETITSTTSLSLDAVGDISLGHSGSGSVIVNSEVVTSVLRSSATGLVLDTSGSEYSVEIGATASDTYIGSCQYAADGTTVTSSLHTLSPLDAVDETHAAADLVLGQASLSVVVGGSGIGTHVLDTLDVYDTLHADVIVTHTTTDNSHLVIDAPTGNVLLGAGSYSVEIGATGADTSLLSNSIVLGQADSGLTLSRPLSSGAGNATTLVAQGGSAESDGGHLFIYAGDAGSVGTSSPYTPAGGSVFIDAGAGKTTSLNGSVSIGTTDASSVIIGKSSGLTQIRSMLYVDGEIQSIQSTLTIDAHDGSITIGSDSAEVNLSQSGMTTTVSGDLSVVEDATVLGDTVALKGTDLVVSLRSSEDYTISMNSSDDTATPGTLSIQGVVNSDASATQGEVVINPLSDGVLRVHSPSVLEDTVTLGSTDRDQSAGYIIQGLGAASGAPAPLHVNGGASESGNGGDTYVSGGYGTADGGDLYLDAGEGALGDNGSVLIGTMALETSILSPETTVSGDVTILGDSLVLGTLSDYTISRPESDVSTVGSLIIEGQSGSLSAGDLELYPGCLTDGSNSCGVVTIGTSTSETHVSHDLYIEGDGLYLGTGSAFEVAMLPITSGDGDTLTLTGATTSLGDGGSVLVTGGTGTGAGSVGGDVTVEGGAGEVSPGKVVIGALSSSVEIGATSVETLIQGVATVTTEVNVPLVQSTGI